MEARAEIDKGLARPGIGDTNVALGWVYRREGDRARADGHLAGAARLFRDLDAPFWAQRAVALLA